MTQRPKPNLWLVPHPDLTGSARADGRQTTVPRTMAQLQGMVGQIADGTDRLEREVTDLIRLLKAHQQLTAARSSAPNSRQAACR
jgi:hypothetical protein